MESTSFSIVVPAYNERSTIAAVLTRLLVYISNLAPAYETEVVVVDDGSTDGTAAIVARFANEHPETIVSVALAANGGLVRAMAAGARCARFPTVVFLDADLSYEPEIAVPLLVARANACAAVAVASPYMRGGRVANVPPLRLAASRGANWLLTRVAGGRFHTFTGMVRAYDRAAFLNLCDLKPVGEFNTWAIAALIARGLGVVEIPAELVWPPERTASPSRLSLGKLWQRVLLVLETMRVLHVAMKSIRSTHGNGTLVLSTRTGGPFFTKS